MATFGKTTQGSETMGWGPNYVTGSRFTLGEAGIVTELSVFIGAYAFGSGRSKIAIYSCDAENRPLNLMGVSDELTDALIPNSIIPFPANIPLTPGEYWLLLFSEQNPQLYHDPVGIARKYLTYNAGDYVVFPDPWDLSPFYEADEMSIYATYTPAEPPPTHILTINSVPISGVEFDIDTTKGVTPFSQDVIEGPYTILMPTKVTDGVEWYEFVSWEDGSTSPSRTINLVSDMTLTATYQPIPTPEGTIDVHAYEDSVEVAASVEIVGIGTYTSPFTITLPVGEYTLNATYGTYPTQTKIATVVEGETTIVDFNFATIPPSPIGAFSSRNQLRYTYFGSESMLLPDWSLVASTIKTYAMGPAIQKALYPMYAPFPLGPINNGIFDVDKLREALDACHALEIEYHISMSVMFGVKDPTHRQVDANGMPVDSWCCASNPMFRDHIKAIVDELVEKYEIDGFSFDYVRYEGTDRCYCQYCKQKFEEYLGEAITDWPGEFAPEGPRYKEFMQWRPNPISELIGLMRTWIETKREQYWPEKAPIEFTATTFGDTVNNLWWIGQDAIFWAKEGYIDAIMPMYYVWGADKVLNLFNQSRALLGGAEGVIPLTPLLTHCHGGIKPPDSWKDEVNAILENNTDGYSSWCYGGPGDNSGWPDIRPYWELVPRPPIFSLRNMDVSPATDSCTITWATDLPATSKVEYSTSPLFVASKIAAPSPDYPYAKLDYWDIDYLPGVVIEDAGHKTSHMIVLTGLLSGTTYYFRIQSEDANGIATSKMFTFTTSGAPPPTAIVTGTVTDSKTGTPIQGSIVEINGYTDVTTLDGKYTITLPLGSYLLTVTKTGYAAYSRTVEATEETTYTIDVVLTSVPPRPCFIATVAYGSSLSSQLNVLRHFRNRCLPTQLVNGYYRIGKYLAKFIETRRSIKRYVREFLNLFIKLIYREVMEWEK